MRTIRIQVRFKCIVRGLNVCLGALIMVMLWFWFYLQLSFLGCRCHCSICFSSSFHIISSFKSFYFYRILKWKEDENHYVALLLLFLFLFFNIYWDFVLSLKMAFILEHLIVNWLRQDKVGNWNKKSQLRNMVSIN